MRCYHHNDLDGRMSAAIVNYFSTDCKFVEVDYHDEIKIEEIQKDEKVFVVDFSFKPEIMEKVLCITRDIVWIDHHKTALEYKYSKEIPGIRKCNDKEWAACELVWEFFCNFLTPEAITLIGDRDKWAWKYGDRTKFFNLGLEIFPQDPTDPFWSMLIKDDKELIEQIIQTGKTCLLYRDALCKDYVKSYGFEVEFEGMKCFAQGLYMFGSEAFAERIDQYPICIAFEYVGDKWIVGLYSKTLDVGEIAKKLGGGGHKGASGFVSTVLPFKKI